MFFIAESCSSISKSYGCTHSGFQPDIDVWSTGRWGCSWITCGSDSARESYPLGCKPRERTRSVSLTWVSSPPQRQGGPDEQPVISRMVVLDWPLCSFSAGNGQNGLPCSPTGILMLASATIWWYATTHIAWSMRSFLWSWTMKNFMVATSGKLEWQHNREGAAHLSVCQGFFHQQPYIISASRCVGMLNSAEHITTTWRVPNTVYISCCYSHAVQ